MKHLSALPALVLVCVSAPAHAQDAAKIANIEEIFRLSNMDHMQQQVMVQMKSMAMTQFQNADLNMSDKDKEAMVAMQDKVFAFLAERVGWEKMKPAYIKIYDETYTTEEVAGIAAFYRTPAGAAMLAKASAIMSKSMQVAQQRMTEIMPELQQLAAETAKKHTEANPARP